MRFVLFTTLLLPPSLLAAYAAHGQGPILYQPSGTPQPRPYPLSTQPPYQAPKRIRVAPTIPVEADGAIKQEPDSATRRQYARHRVRTVLKIRLSKQGEVKDTVEYRRIDGQGRWTEEGRWHGPVYRQWSYNGSGQCTALVEHPHSARQYTVINTYNPGLGRGQQEVLQRDGTHTLVQEKQLYQNGDTLLTEIKAHELIVDNYQYPEYVQRSLRLVPHPDTTLSLTAFYDHTEQPSGYQFDYLLYQRGRLLEAGKLNSFKVSPAANTPGAETLGPAQALATLRQGTWLQPQERRFYDSQHRLIRHEVTRAKDLRSPHTIIHYTYNALGQLIGRETATTNPGTGIRATYTVYSYSPTGLLAGETTDARSNRAVFYRYHYQYYD